MLGITPFGALHTVISLIALGAGLIAFIRDKEISPRNLLGKVYVVGTVLTCVTGFFIFHHGGFGKPHVLGIITLIVLGIAAVAGYTNRFGRASRYVETIGYSLTVFFHFFPLITETSTRLPAGAAAPERRCAAAANGYRRAVRPVPDRRHAAGDAPAVHLAYHRHAFAFAGALSA